MPKLFAVRLSSRQRNGRQVVAIALTRCGAAEGLEDDVGHALRRADVAADDGRSRTGIEDGAGRQLDGDRDEAALIERDVEVDKTAQRVDDRRVSDRRGRVEVAERFEAGALEVENGRAGIGVDRDGQLDRQAIVQMINRVQRGALTLRDLA